LAEDPPEDTLGTFRQIELMEAEEASFSHQLEGEGQIQDDSSFLELKERLNEVLNTTSSPPSPCKP
jgi:hypothetical protein